MKNKFWVFILLSTFYFLPSTLASAHGTAFFEFNPDSFSNGSVLVAQTGEVYQLFVPQNDYLGGIDLWFSNAGQASAASVYLYSQAGNLLTSKTISIPAIPYSQSGLRIHIDFSSQLPVTSADVYSLKIQSSDQNLRLYYAPRIETIQHNAPFASQYQNGVAKISGQEQSFSFKFALYETTESTPPVISNLSAVAVTPDEALISFNANEPVDFKVDYGPQGQGYVNTGQFSGAYTFCIPGINMCQKTLATEDGVTYEFLLTVKDIWGNQSTATGTFTSAGSPPTSPTPSTSSGPSASPTATPAPDTTKPVISNLRIIALTTSSIQVAWSTDEAANSSYLISLMPLLTTVAAGGDTTFELEHFVDSGEVLTFGAGVQYIIRVTSGDMANNISSQSLTFTTPQQTATPTPPPGTTPTATPPPAPSSSTTPQVQPQSDGTTQVSWEPSEESAGGYRVDIFDQNGKLVKSEFVPSGTHSLNTNLADGQYTVVVYASESGAFKKVSPPASVKVGAKSFWEKILSPVGIFTILGVILAIIAAVVIVLKRMDKKETIIPVQNKLP